LSEINEALTEGISANNWTPGAWANTPNYSEDEWQPDIEPPHINDYAAFKKHKHYGQYFRPYRYHAFPAWVYHKTEEPKIVKSKEEVLALGPDWSPIPNKPRIDMTGKSQPVKSETQRLAEVVAQALAVKQPGAGGIDATAIAAVVAAVMAATAQQQKPASATKSIAEASPDTSGTDGLRAFVETPIDEENPVDGSIERKALIELAEKEGIKIDKRWANDRIKKELGL
jgi:hypothetical protein